MDEHERLKSLLMAAYGAGVKAGAEWGLSHFDEWFANLDHGDVITGMAAVSNARLPCALPGEKVVFDGLPNSLTSMVVVDISYDGSGLRMTLQDATNYERERQMPPW